MIKLLYDVNFWYAMCLVIIVATAVSAVKIHMKKLASEQTSAVRMHHAESIGIAEKEWSRYPYELTLKIGGMNCVACAKRVENMLNRKKGVMAQADIHTQKVTVLFQNKADAERFCHDIEAIHPYLSVKVKERRRTI